MTSPSQVARFLAGLITAICIQTAAAQDPPVFQPFKRSGQYELNEVVGWHVAAPRDARLSDRYRYTIRRNNLDPVGAGTLDLSQAARIEVSVNEPAMLYVEVVSTAPDAKPFALGAAIAPEKLRPSAPEPADFDRFWSRKIRALSHVPARPQLTQKPSDRAGVDYFTLQMDHVDGKHVHGQVAKPQRPGKFPGLVLFQWASPPYPLQQQWVTERAAQGWLVVNIQPHDVLPDAPQSYYDALPKELKEYSNIGRDDRDRNYFLQMYLADYRALEYLAGRSDWDGRTLVVMGTSMGGQQSLCAAALNPKVTGVIAHMPSGADSNGPQHGRAAGYPFWNAENAQVLKTSLYFDTVNCAARIKAPTLVSMGYLDTVAPPVGIYIAFNRIKGYKEVVPLIDSPHNHLATPAQEAPFKLRAEQWLQTFLAGGDVAALPPASH